MGRGMPRALIPGGTQNLVNQPVMPFYLVLYVATSDGSGAYARVMAVYLPDTARRQQRAGAPAQQRVASARALF